MFTFIPETITAIIRLFTQEQSNESVALSLSQLSVSPFTNHQNARRFWLESL